MAMKCHLLLLLLFLGWTNNIVVKTKEGGKGRR
jgi:hypothetical protein